MTQPTPDGEPRRLTRLLFLGEDGLADGFRLIGFETHTDLHPDAVERLFKGLLREREHAFVIVDDRLMDADIPSLRQARREGGRIVVIAVPPLQGAPRLSSDVATRVKAMFGDGSGLGD